LGCQLRCLPGALLGLAHGLLGLAAKSGKGGSRKRQGGPGW
jgi:hypothetical protein